jgi:hypothetical protein
LMLFPTHYFTFFLKNGALSAFTAFFQRVTRTLKTPCPYTWKC